MMKDKVKYFLLAFVPSIALMAIQSASSEVVAVFLLMKNADNLKDILAFALAKDTTLMLGKMISVAMVLYLLASLLLEVFVAVYVFKWRPTKSKFECVTFKNLIALVLFAIGAVFILEIMLNWAMITFPKLAASYNKVLDILGLIDFTPFTMAVMCVLAPIVEEIALRGFTLKLFEKAFDKFWVANILQAIVFGALHGNVIQGVYAFLLGLGLGYLYKRFDSLMMNILAHVLVNTVGTLGINFVVEKFGDLQNIIIILPCIGAVLMIVGYFVMNLRVKASE